MIVHCALADNTLSVSISRGKSEKGLSASYIHQTFFALTPRFVLNHWSVLNGLVTYRKSGILLVQNAGTFFNALVYGRISFKTVSEANKSKQKFKVG